MDFPQIVKELESGGNKFPRQALETCVANREEAVPELLRILEQAIDDPDSFRIRAEDDMLLDYVLYLLAQFREKRAYPLIARLVSLPGTDPFLLTDPEVITDDLQRILASVSCGDGKFMRDLIENVNADPYVRGAAMRGLVTLVACGEKPREDVVAYFQLLLRDRSLGDDGFVRAQLVSAALEIYAEEAYEDIRRCFQEDAVDTFFVSWSSVQRQFRLGREKVLEQLAKDAAYTLVEDTIGELSDLPIFQPSEPVTERGERKPKTDEQISPALGSHPPVQPAHVATRRVGVRVGRNAPCPCGSGRKYKKCCGKV